VIEVPRSWTDMSPAWVTTALSRHCPGVEVADVAAGPVADGTNRRGQLKLTYASGEGPPSVFVKLHGRLLHRLALMALGALTTEACLAEAGLRFPLDHPQAYAGGIDPPTLRTVVVMDDVTNLGGRPHDATRPLTVDQVATGLAGLARLHGAYWDKPLPGPLDFLRPWRLGAGWAPVSAASLARGFSLLRRRGVADRMPAGVSPFRLERQFRSSAVLAATGPQTVLHGDPHPGNTYALADGTTGFYDWQLARTGNWAHDVGYFLISSLTTEERARHQEDLLAGYLDALAGAGGQPPPWPAAWDRYRAAPAFGLATWVHTVAGGRFQAADVCTVTIQRFAAAYAELGTERSLVTP
jgi:hypothetical protein